MESPIDNESYAISQIVSMLAHTSVVLVEAGITELTIPNIPFNIVYISADNAEIVSSISANLDGYMVLIIAEDNNITIQSNAQLNLNSSPAGTDFVMSQQDILAFICRGSVYQELFRTEKN